MPRSQASSSPSSQQLSCLLVCGPALCVLTSRQAAANRPACPVNARHRTHCSPGGMMLLVLAGKLHSTHCSKQRAKPDGHRCASKRVQSAAQPCGQLTSTAVTVLRAGCAACRRLWVRYTELHGNLAAVGPGTHL